MRSGSSRNAPSVTARSKPREMSARPSKGSNTRGSGRGRGEIHGDGVYGEVAQRQVIQQVRNAQPGHVHFQRLARFIGQDRPAHIAPGVEHERRAAEGIRYRSRQPDATLGHHKIEVMAGPPQQPVAHEAADQPRRALLVTDEGSDPVSERQRSADRKVGGLVSHGGQKLRCFMEAAARCGRR